MSDEEKTEKKPCKDGIFKRFFRYLKNNPKIVIIAILILIPALYFGGGAFLHATSKASFCISCHEMGNVCATWSRSKHSQKGVECIDCHVKPGKLNYILAKILAVKHGFYHIMVKDPDKMKKLIRESAKAPWEACYNCHKDIRSKTMINGIRIPHHNDELTEKMCTKCHWKVAHADITEKSHPDMKGCFECHNDIKAPRSKCEICHPTEGENFYSSFKGKAGIMCVDCHIPLTDFRASEKSCIRCHRGNKKYGEVFKKWQHEVTDLMKRADSDMEKLDELIKKGAIEKDGFLQKYMDEYNELKIDKSKGVHNFEKISTRYTNLVNALEKTIGMVDKNFKPHIIARSENSCIRNCHSGIENVKVEHNTVIFDHGKHIKKGKLVCVDCHTGFEDHGKTINHENCVGCHHWDVKEDRCQYCHVEVRKLYYGTIIDEKKPIPSFKAKAEVKCVDCHKIVSGMPQKGQLVKTQCINCHDEKMANVLDEWLKKEADLIKRLNIQISKKSGKEKELLLHMKKGKPIHNLNLVEEHLKKLEKIK